MAHKWPPPRVRRPLIKLEIHLPWWLRRWFQWHEWRWLYRRFIEFFIRGRRGWAPSDTWGLDHYIAQILAEALPYLAEHKHGWPAEFFPDGGLGTSYTEKDNQAAQAAWTAWLHEKGEWFDWYARDDDGTSDALGWIAEGMSKEEKHRRIDAYNAKMKEFYEVVLPDFVRHFGSLWD